MIYLTLVLAFFGGYYLREVLETLRKLEKRVTKEEKPKPASSNFGEVMTRAEVVAMLEQEKVDALNR